MILTAYIKLNLLVLNVSELYQNAFANAIQNDTQTHQRAEVIFYPSSNESEPTMSNIFDKILLKAQFEFTV